MLTSLSPDRRARNTLFGEHMDDLPIQWKGTFWLPGSTEEITFEALVARYAAEDASNAASN
jgi:hypothetical protein